MKPIESVTLIIAIGWAVWAVARTMLAPLGKGAGKCATCGDSCGCAPTPKADETNKNDLPV